MPQTPPRAPLAANHRVSLRIDDVQGKRFGPGKAELMRLIAEHGSISAAGRAMGMSYRRAWLLVEQINGLTAQPLIESRAGGAQGGGARLTATGEAVLRAYRDLEADIAQCPAMRRFSALLTRGDCQT